jgi:hypothetical protein
MILSSLPRRLPLLIGLSMLAMTPVTQAVAQGAAAVAAPAPLSSLVSAVDIPR